VAKKWEEVEVQERPDSSPIINSCNEREEGKKVFYSSFTSCMLLRSPAITMVTNGYHHENQKESDNNTIPGLDIFDSDLTGVEDVPVLQLPETPPTDDDECMDYTVCKDCVKDEFVADIIIIELGTKVTGRIENIIILVSFYCERHSSCAMEGFEEHEDDTDNNKDSGETEPRKKDWKLVKKIKSLNPHQNTEDGIKIQDYGGGKYLLLGSFVSQDFSD